ncbi:MAG: glycosyltransferase family 1 protein [Chloroflexaceae bacterium]|nr:glycosyltransferase family 1 protein [Chloroflexaceae bacterium]
MCGYGIPFAPLNDEFIRLADTPEGQQAIEDGAGWGLIRKIKPMLRRMLDDTWAATRGGDSIVYHPKALAGSHLGEKLGIPSILSVPLPLYSPTTAFSIPVMRPLPIGGVFNRASYLITRLISAPYNDVINDWRSSLSLKPRPWWADELRHSDGSRVPVLYSISPHVVPPPADWPTDTYTTGYWTLPEPAGWQPPPELVNFLQAGDRPVYVGFGSMVGTDSSGKARIVIEALQAAGVRGLLATGWGGLTPSDVPDSMYVIEQAPHTWLFEHVAAVVHHGGAGTTAAGLRAGRPTIICPFFGDQHFWGERVRRLGVGTQAIPQKELTVDKLAAALRTVTSDSAIQARAAALGAKLRAEDGVSNAVHLIEHYLQQWKNPPWQS